jgi:hypothetical protein
MINGLFESMNGWGEDINSGSLPCFRGQQNGTNFCELASNRGDRQGRVTEMASLRPKVYTALTGLDTA